ncbi:MAG: hypothetical protein ACI8Y4_004991 [Candidatus Poriferisodalaceae bacterium]
MVAGWLSIPVYFGLEAIIRVLNVGKDASMDAAMRAAMVAAHVDVDMDRLRLVAPATLPIKNPAITLGHTVFARRSMDGSDISDVHLMAHELCHVVQRERLGRVAMAVHYGRGWVEGFSYTDHVMEVEARAYADEALPNLRDHLKTT